MKLQEFCDSLRIVVIQFSGRSGSFLLSNLFDSAEEVLSCPPDALLGNFLINLRKLLTKEEDSWIDEIALLAPNLFEHSDDVNSDIGVNEEEFKGYLGRLLNEMKYELSGLNVNLDAVTGTVFKLIHIAYSYSKRINVENKKIIVWQQHMPFDSYKAKMAIRAFTQLKCITCIRHPLLTLDSHFLHVKSGYGSDNTKQYSLSRLIAKSYYNSLVQEESNQGIDHIAVRFEDMHLKTKELMQKLCIHLGISYSPIMESTTLDGETFYFKGANKIITGTNINIMKNNLCKIFTCEDLTLLKNLLWRVGEAYNYEFDKIKNSDKTEHILSNQNYDSLVALGTFSHVGRFKSYPLLIRP